MEGADRITFVPKDEPHGWIHWKSTTICMDIHCICGKKFHIDASCAYYVRCSVCKRVYYCNPNVEFVELNDDERQRILNDGFYHDVKEKHE
jgi:hypothetical protein